MKVGAVTGHCCAHPEHHQTASLSAMQWRGSLPFTSNIVTRSAWINPGDEQPGSSHNGQNGPHKLPNKHWQMALTEKSRPTRRESPELCPESRWMHCGETWAFSVVSIYLERSKGDLDNNQHAEPAGEEEASWPEGLGWGLTTSRLGCQGLALGHKDYLALNIGYVMQIVLDQSVALVHKKLNNAFVFIWALPSSHHLPLQILISRFLPHIPGLHGHHQEGLKGVEEGVCI